MTEKPINIVSGTRALGAAVHDSHRVAVRVEILAPNPWAPSSLAGVINEVIDGTVSLDASAEARGRVTLTLPATEELIPTSPASSLAPFGAELRVSRGVEYDDRVDLVQLGVFRIDSCTVSGNTITVEGLDRSAQFIDAIMEEPGQWSLGEPTVDVIHSTLQGGATSSGYEWDFAEHDGTLPQTITWEEGDDRWALCQSFATSIGAELYFDSRGVLVLRPIPADHGGADVGTYDEGPGGVLLSAGRSFDRTTVTNRVIVTGENTNPDEIARGYATDDNPNSPTYIYGRFGRKTLFTTSSFIAPVSLGGVEMANDMARGILNRSMGAPDVIEFEAIVNPGLRPSDTVIITRELLGLNEKHVIDAVDIPLSATSPMACRTRAVELFTT